MCCCAIECVQCCVYFLNILLMLSGLGLLAIGVILLINGVIGTFSILVPGLPYLYVSIFLLVAALIILGISLYGCLASFRGDVCALIWYYVLIVIVLCLEASALVMTFTYWRSGGYHPQITDYIINRVQGSMDRYGMTGEEDFTKAWDNLQIKKECCGVISDKDWYREALFEDGRPPDSCCEVYYEGCSKAVNGATIWEQGCEEFLVEDTFRGLSVVGSIVIVFIFIQIVLLLFVLILIFLLKFGNDPKNTCCGPAYVKPADESKYPNREKPAKKRPAVTKSSSWRQNPLYNEETKKVDRGTDL